MSETTSGKDLYEIKLQISFVYASETPQDKSQSKLHEIPEKQSRRDCETITTKRNCPKLITAYCLYFEYSCLYFLRRKTKKIQILINKMN